MRTAYTKTKNSNYNDHTRSDKCLRTSIEAFAQGDVDAAIRNLKITFNHVTNTDWTDSDTQRILNFLSWLYFYDRRFDQAIYALGTAIEHCENKPELRNKYLPFLHYNLAENYRRIDQHELSRHHYSLALQLISSQLGSTSKSYILIQQRHHSLFLAPDISNDKKIAQTISSHQPGQERHQFQASVHALARLREPSMC